MYTYIYMYFTFPATCKFNFLVEPEDKIYTWYIYFACTLYNAVQIAVFWYASVQIIMSPEFDLSQRPSEPKANALATSATLKRIHMYIGCIVN